METVSFAGPLLDSGILKKFKVEPAPGKDLFVLPDTPAVWRARRLFAGSDSAPFVTTFGDLSHTHCRTAGRKLILSRTGREILMHKTAGDVALNGKDGGHPVAELLELNTGFKQSGTSPGEIIKKSGDKLPEEIIEKLAALEPLLKNFEDRMRESAMTDDTSALIELAGAVERGKADIINGKFRRIIAAGFHRLTPSHIRVLEAAERKGIKILRLCSGKPEKKQDSSKTPAVCLSSFDFLTNEADFAASQIRSMIDGGRSLADFAVIVRDLTSSAPVIANAFERGGVPVTIQSGMRLGAASGISVFLKDLFAAAHDREGDGFIRLIRNPMLKPFFRNTGNILEVATAMETEAVKNGVRLEKDALFDAMTGPLHKNRNFTACLKKVAELKNMLSEISIADGETKKAAAIFGSLSEIVDKTETYKARGRDNSLEETRNLLREASFLSQKWNEEFSSSEELSDFVSELLANRRCSYKTPSAGSGVPVMSALQSRGTSYPVVFILGCTERSFPGRPRESAIFNNEEKELINRFCKTPALTTDAVYLSDERLIWCGAVACAEERLHISFSKNGKGRGSQNRSLFIQEIPESSIIWDRKQAEIPPNPYSTEAVRARDFALNRKISEETKKLLAQTDPFSSLAEAAERGTAAENERLQTEGVFGRFEGVVDESEDHWWEKLRVTDIEKFGTCPFMFFCSNVLGIREKEENTEIPTARDTGSLYHEALRHVFSSGGKTGTALRNFLDGEETKKRYCKFSDGVWEIQKERARLILGRFIDFEKKRIREKKFKPEFFEREIRLVIANAEIRGRIDRIDTDGEGGIRLVDYKKGALPETFCDRKSLQIPLYLAAFSRETGMSPSAGAYISVERPWEMNERTGGDKKGIEIDRAAELAESNINLIKDGFFSPVPVRKPEGFPYKSEMSLGKTGRPCDFCSYSDICRIKNGTLRRAARTRN